VRRVVSAGLSARNATGLKVRQPLARVVVSGPASVLAAVRCFAPDVCEEVNVEDVEFADTSPAGTAVASDGDVVVALDIELTPDLRRKGAARAIAHHVQVLRKRAALEVADRIQLSLAAPPEMLALVQEHGHYICEETLAVSLTLGPPAAGATTEKVRVDGAEVTLGVEATDRITH
jgi:isoleucyl-tRNA synthetase